MRDRLLARLGDVPHRRFLVYVMGPYKTFRIADLADGDPEELPVDFGESSANHEDGEMLDRLFRVRDRLRTEPGVNAFLAIDADIDVAEVDAATQSIELARASNVVVFVAPNVGKNLGVGIETGSVLEDVYRDGLSEDHRQERVVFVHEDGVRSAMIAAITRRWDATVYSYADEDELMARVRQFVANVMNRELLGELPSLDEE